jgi:putative membrane protein
MGMLRRFGLRWFVNFIGLWVASGLLSGIQYNDKIAVLVIAALVFSLVNALIRPVVLVLALPAIILTLGLFTLVVNGLMLYLVMLIYPRFHVSSLWSALGAVMVVWLVNYLLNDLLVEKKQAA